MRRCGAAAWSCGRLCGERLPCGHRCPLRCHPGACKPCKLSGEKRALIGDVHASTQVLGFKALQTQALQVGPLVEQSFTVQMPMLNREVQLPVWSSD